MRRGWRGHTLPPQTPRKQASKQARGANGTQSIDGGHATESLHARHSAIVKTNTRFSFSRCYARTSPPKTCLTSRLTTPDRHLPQALKKQDRVAPRALKTPSYASKQDSNRGGPSAQVRRLFMHGRRRDRLIGASRTRHVQRRSNSAHNRAACEHRASGRQEGRKSGAEIRTS